jgi:hypothetical protein
LCPKCNNPAQQLFINTPLFYIRGNGYLDKEGCKRDMNLYHLTRNDPYKNMRERGEKDDLINKLKQGGKRKKNAKIII